jgi:hypothetical protein
MMKTKVFSLSLAVASALVGMAHAGQEIAQSDKKQVTMEEPEKLRGSISAGYSSRYIFRGTNLMPSSNGMLYADAHVSYGGFTFGVWAGTQQGSATVEGARSIGEGGGGGAVDFGNREVTSGVIGTGSPLGGVAGQREAAFGQQGAITGEDLVSFIGANYGVTNDTVVSVFNAAGIGRQFPQEITKFKTSTEAIQDRFNEIDIYLQYQFSLGPVDVTIGNIFFYIDRDATTRVTFREYFASEDAKDLVDFLSNLDASFGGFLPGVPRAGHPEDILTNQGRKVSRTFEGIEDEQYDRAFISLSTAAIPFITPRLTYYHTLYNEGTEAAKELKVLRNDEKGGYLEFKVNASIPVIKDRVNIDPYALVSASFGDRSAPDGSALYDWNHFQVGTEIVIQITDNFAIIPQINYMHHISEPPLGTRNNDWWGGAKAEVIF